MKWFTIKKMLICILALILASIITTCNNIVEPEVFSEMTPETVLTTEAGIKGTLIAGYTKLAIRAEGRIIGSLEFTTDIAWETGGGANQWAVPFIHLRYEPSTPNLMNMWSGRYQAIRNANIVIENIDNLNISKDKKQLYRAEARFIRAVSYIYLNRWFGPVPLRTSSEEDLQLPRASKEEMRSFIESELSDIIPTLPVISDTPYGRAHKDAALAFLAKFYLNTKQWQKAANTAKDIIDGNRFSLYPSYPDMFRVENEQNSEYIWVYQKIVGTGDGNVHMNATLPPSFSSYPPLNMQFTPSMNNWARQDRLMDDFADSFELGDERRNLIADWYVNQAGDRVSLRDLPNNQRAFKYPLDPNAIGNSHGNDIPAIRYADILLTRAEALNELNGPNQESIDLVNEVRNRAGLGDITLSDFKAKEELRKHIVMKERGWEFYWEGKRRQDLIRIGKYIEVSQSLGEDYGNPTAEDFRVLFPIPLQAMDSNPELKQNPGY